MGRKSSDELAVPLCAIHHRDLHDHGNEMEWWRAKNMDPLPIALRLWEESQSAKSKSEDTQASESRRRSSFQHQTCPYRPARIPRPQVTPAQKLLFVAKLLIMVMMSLRDCNGQG
jgi:hypothetical protein